MRDRTPFLKQLGAIPSCVGLMTRQACEYALSARMDLPPLLHRAGLTLRDIRDESGTISVSAQIRCLNLIAAAMNDKLLGFHVAQHMDLRRTGFLYYVAASAEFLGDGLLKIARYSGTVNEGVELQITIGKTLRIRFTYSGVSRQSDRHQIEAWITALVRFCREMTDQALRPLHVRLMHYRIPESDEFDSFLGEAAEFGADNDEIVFPKEASNLRIASADPYLNKLLTEHSEHVIASRKPTSAIQAQVANAISALLPHGQASVDAVAKRLGMGSRTMRRRLSDEGTTFARILQDLRIGLAKHYLAERNLSISRIAWLVGYTEVSAFSHAFRRWTGQTPRADRAKAKGSSRTRNRPARKGSP